MTRPAGIVEPDLASNAYEEAVRATEAAQIQLFKRRQALNSVPGWDADRRAASQSRVDEAIAMHEAAEMREYACWQLVDRLRKCPTKCGR